MSDAFAAQPEWLVLDLAGLTFMDATGVHLAIDTHNRASAESVHLVIVPGPRSVQRVFEVCGVAETLPFGGQDSAPPASGGREVPQRLLSGAPGPGGHPLSPPPE